MAIPAPKLPEPDLEVPTPLVMDTDWADEIKSGVFTKKV